MRATNLRRAIGVASFVAFTLTSSACQTADQTADLTREVSKPRIQSAPTTPTIETTPTTIAPTTTVPAPIIPDDYYVTDGFAIQPPPGWKLIDQQSIADGTISAGIPVESVETIVQEVDNVFANGALVAFYRFDDSTQYTPSITLSRQEPQAEADASSQAANTVTDLQEQGFVDVSSTVGSAPAGTSVGVSYTAPASRTGFGGDLFASSYVVFGADATWTFTGLTSDSPQLIDDTVSSLANSLIET